MQLKTVFRNCVVFYLISVVMTDDINTDICAYPKHNPGTDLPPAVKRALGVLTKLTGTRFVDKDDKGEYEYKIGICTKADDDAMDNVGVVQVKVKDKHKHRIGFYNDSHLTGGTDWISLEYRGGENYGTHCTHENKKAIIMIVCDPNDSEGHGKVVEENNQKTDECYYLFEYSHSAVCTEVPSFQLLQGLSAGSVIIIIFISLMALYCIVGLLYQRFVRGAKGMEQIPNYAFWQDFGNLQADGCDLVCRSGQRFSSRAYKGIGDDQLGDDEQDIDDHLLPM
ncbi:cation-dependent mannose-6-phosphate receptor [Lingula anatina]|uniref:Cation-dependent mannose-6-phosphate receptor n=1 Tax=Lingula anatina TaxID=7574 RepID=A0A1S3HGU1_LINAN|nr:cation-dependent mannose-6-phosphate receptor [Lingula anatina]|eukprot:XP_013385262.1 cation-dependent mannose-6-phosphate receptor [Lingula anatina]